jgi:hypothetical protein
MACRSVRQVTEIARLWMVRHGAFVSAGTVRQESDAACPSDPRDGFIDFPLLDGPLYASRFPGSSLPPSLPGRPYQRHEADRDGALLNDAR